MGEAFSFPSPQPYVSADFLIPVAVWPHDKPGQGAKTQKKKPILLPGVLASYPGLLWGQTNAKCKHMGEGEDTQALRSKSNCIFQHWDSLTEMAAHLILPLYSTKT